MTTKIEFIPPHSDSSLNRKIDYYKWVVLLCSLIVPGTAALYYNFKISGTWIAYFYVIGWTCLTFTVWILFQGIYLMACTGIYTIPLPTQKKIQKILDKEKHKVTPWLLDGILTLFRVAPRLPEFAVYSFMIGFFLLAIAVYASVLIPR